MSDSSSSLSWDAQAATFDLEPDHGLQGPGVRAAWRELLLRHVPAAPSRVLDVGCGTGSLSCLLAQEGHLVTGVDFSLGVLGVASRKAFPLTPRPSFVVGDASSPPVPPGSFDVVLTRHVLWALPDPLGALRTWVSLLVLGGRLVLVEGLWHTGAGLAADVVAGMVAEVASLVEVVPLPDEALWGGPVQDERYLVLARP